MAFHLYPVWIVGELWFGSILVGWNHTETQSSFFFVIVNTILEKKVITISGFQRLYSVKINLFFINTVKKKWMT